MGVFAILGIAIIEVAKRFIPISTTLQSPSVVLLVTVMILCPLIILSARKVLTLVVNLEMAHLELLIVLSKAIAQRDNATEEHNLRVAITAVYLAITIGLDWRLIPGLFIGALLYDVGKLASTTIIREIEQGHPLSMDLPDSLHDNLVQRLSGGHLPVVAMTSHAKLRILRSV